MPRKLTRMAIRLLLLLVVLVLTWWVALYLLQDLMLFPRGMAPAPLPQRPDFVSTVLTVELDGGGQVEGWYCPAPRPLVPPGAEAEAEPAPARGRAGPGPTVIVFHGNAEVIDYQDDVVWFYHRRGVNVLLPEYRGYGRSGGKPSQKALGADMVKFYDALLELPGVDAQRIFFHGRSVGGGVAADLATKRRPAAIVLLTTFDSVAAMGRHYLAPGFLVRNPFRNDQALAGYDGPVLLAHGTRDTIVPVSHPRKLRDALRDVEYIEYPCGHNDFPGLGNEEDFNRRLTGFLVRRGLAQEP